MIMNELYAKCTHTSAAVVRGWGGVVKYRKESRGDETLLTEGTVRERTCGGTIMIWYGRVPADVELPQPGKMPAGGLQEGERGEFPHLARCETLMALVYIHVL